MNHLPECGYTPEQLGFGGINSGIDSTQPFISGHPCICDRLRACEQRVNSSNLTMWDRTQEQAQQMVTSGLGIAWKDGFKEGINAAREAVAALQMGVLTTVDLLLKRQDALAALDTLKEKS